MERGELLSCRNTQSILERIGWIYWRHLEPLIHDSMTRRAISDKAPMARLKGGFL